MPVRTTPMRPPVDEEQILRPLREIGMLDNTQDWSPEDVRAALRFAYARGIDPEKLYGTADRLVS